MVMMKDNLSYNWSEITENLTNNEQIYQYQTSGMHSSHDQPVVTVDNAINMCKDCLDYANQLETYLGIMVIAFMLLLIYILYKRGRFSP